MLIAIEGIDGVGKGTQSKILYEQLVSRNLKCILLSFPIYSSFFGIMVGEYLNGLYGPLNVVDPRLSGLLYALDRWQAFKSIDHESFDVILIDRYVPSNLAHQGAKAIGVKRKEIISWIRELEYEIFSLPAPDLVVLLNADAEIASKQILKKGERTYTRLDKDLHESDESYIKEVRNVFLELANTDLNYVIIECSTNGVMRSILEIQEEIWTNIKKRV